MSKSDGISQKTDALNQCARMLAVYRNLLIFALTSSFRLLLTLYRRLFIVFSLANFSDNAVFRTRSLEALQRSVQRLVLTNANFCHLHFPPFATTAEANFPFSKAKHPIYTTAFRMQKAGISNICHGVNIFCNIDYCTTYCLVCQALFLHFVILVILPQNSQVSLVRISALPMSCQQSLLQS